MDTFHKVDIKNIFEDIHKMDVLQTWMYLITVRIKYQSCSKVMGWRKALVTVLKCYNDLKSEGVIRCADTVYGILIFMDLLSLFNAKFLFYFQTYVCKHDLNRTCTWMFFTMLCTDSTSGYLKDLISFSSLEFYNLHWLISHIYLSATDVTLKM